MYNSMGQSGSKCYPFSATFSLEKVFIVIVLGVMNIQEDYTENKKKLTLVHVSAHNSKLILPQSASFSHAGTHILTSRNSRPNLLTFFKLYIYLLGRICEPIISEYAQMCPDLTYTMTSFPNLLGQSSQDEAAIGLKYLHTCPNQV